MPSESEIQRRLILDEIREMTKTAAKPKGIKLVTTGLATGAGHLSQAKNLAAAARERGIPAEVVEFDKAFANKKDVKDFDRKYKDVLSGGDTPYASAAKAYFQTYVMNPNREKVRKFVEENRDQAIVVTNAHLELPFRGQKHPVQVLHTDPVNWPTDIDLPGGGGPRPHIGAKQVVEGIIGIGGERKGLRGLPVHPSVTRKQKPSGLMDKKNFNVTVSAGGVAVEVPEMTEEVLKSGLPSNARVHAIAGRNKRALKRLKAMAKKDPRLVPHGFVPLPSMMQEANLNVIRSHGTTFAETQASGKPAVYYAPQPTLTDFQGHLTKRTALHGEKTVGNPAAIGLENIPGTVEMAVKREPELLRKSRAAQRRFGNPADEAVRFIMKPRPEYEKVAYTEKNHLRLIHGAVRQLGKLSPTAKKIISEGTLDADIGIRAPWLIINDPIHAFPNMKKEDAFKEVEKVKGRGVAAVASAMVGKGTNRDAVQGLLDIGQGSHTLADISAHMEKPVVGGESAVRLVNNGLPDGFGGVVPALVEHLQTGREIDTFKPKTNKVDRTAAKRQERYGKDVKKSILQTLQGEHGLSSNAARKNYNQFMRAFKPGGADKVLGKVVRNTKFVREQLGRAASSYRKLKVHGLTG
jgi:UDP-N-acetylglucosamine:LPS N-acetylglucosamine transferase